MTESEFIAGLPDSPADEDKLIFADWLEEQGEGDKAVLWRWLVKVGAHPMYVSRLFGSVQRIVRFGQPYIKLPSTVPTFMATRFNVNGRSESDTDFYVDLVDAMLDCGPQPWNRRKGHMRRSCKYCGLGLLRTGQECLGNPLFAQTFRPNDYGQTARKHVGF